MDGGAVIVFCGLVYPSTRYAINPIMDITIVRFIIKQITDESVVFMI